MLGQWADSPSGLNPPADQGSWGQIPVHVSAQHLASTCSRCTVAAISPATTVTSTSTRTRAGGAGPPRSPTKYSTRPRSAEHAAAHDLDTVHVILHGGEPLLAGRARLRRAAEELTRALEGVCALDLRIQTNAITLDERFCDLFAEFSIKVGISLDGDKAANDRYQDRRSSHERGCEWNRPPTGHLFAGVLCTIDVRNDSVAVYHALAGLTLPRVDFLLPMPPGTSPRCAPLRTPTARRSGLAAGRLRPLDRERPPRGRTDLRLRAEHAAR